eukprot:m.199896 g.199896  ORF g.199896 m.199896 type:complete len:501 (-) comp32754_c0_seq1:416-1918(-)
MAISWRLRLGAQLMYFVVCFSFTAFVSSSSPRIQKHQERNNDISINVSRWRSIPVHHRNQLASMRKLQRDRDRDKVAAQNTHRGHPRTSHSYKHKREHIFAHNHSDQLLPKLSNPYPPDPMPSNFSSDGVYSLGVIIAEETFYLQLDTGSSDLGVASKDCQGCQDANVLYTPSKLAIPLNCTWCDGHTTVNTSIQCKAPRSSTTPQCCMRITYEDQSGYSAALWQDDVGFFKDLNVRAYVGAIYRAEKFFDGVVDGIIGFAGKGVSSADAPTPLDIMVDQGNFEDVFSICLRRTGGGLLYLGAIPDLVESPAVRWSPRLNTTDFYAIEIVDVAVGQISIGVDKSVYNDGYAIVDSGTSDACFPHPAFVALKAAFTAQCATGVCLRGICDCKHNVPLETSIFENNCVSLTPQQLSLFPNITIAMDGEYAKIVQMPQDYLQSGAVFCDDNEYTISWSNCGPTGSGTILGDTFMEGFVVVHDRRMPQRIGFLRTNTSTPCPLY